MKIKKIKDQGQLIYPATITSAIKDPNFLKDNRSAETQEEINQEFNTSITEINSSITSLESKFTDYRLLPITKTETATTLTPEVNTIHKYTSPLTSLSIGYLDASQESVIYFTAASSGCTLSVNNSYQIIGVLNIYANTKYVISILNGVLVMGEIA